VKKAEHRRIDAFELWCWRRLLRVPWTARRSNQSILKEISPGISLEGMILKLKLQYLGHLMRRVDSLEKTLMLGGIGGRRRRGRQRMRLAGWHHWLDGRESQWTPGDGDGQGGLACCDSWGRKESDATERLNWTEMRQIKWEALVKFTAQEHRLTKDWDLITGPENASPPPTAYTSKSLFAIVLLTWFHMSAFQQKIIKMYRKAKHSSKRNKPQNQTWQGCWNYQNLKQAWLMC